MNKKLYSCSLSLALLFNSLFAPFAPLVTYANEGENATVEENLYQVGLQDGEIVVTEGEELNIEDEFNGTGTYFHITDDNENVLLLSGIARAKTVGYVEELYRISNTSYDLTKLVKNWATQRGIPRLKARIGNTVYTPFCIEPGVMHETGGNMDATDYYKRLTDAQKSKLNLILKYGFQNNGNTSDDSYVATQVAIWEVVVGNKNYGDVWKALIKGHSTREKLYTEIIENVKNDGKMPSFVNAKTNSQNIELKWDGKAFTATLEDKNGVLSKFTEVSGNGQIKVTRNGNKITLSTTNPNASSTITLAQKQTLGGKTLFWESSKQNLITGGSLTPYSLNIKATIRTLGNLTITKQGATGEFVPNTTFKITGMGIEKTLTTDKNGQITLTDIEAGTYTVTETSVPAPYLLDTTPKKVTVEVAKTATLNVVNQVAKGRIQINKTGEQLVAINKTKGNYEFIYQQKELSDVTFSIYAKKDIVDSSGKVIYKANDLVQRVSTDNGKALSSELPLGEYYIKEISAPAGMVVEEKTIDVKLAYKNSTTSVVTEVKGLTNTRQKVEISLQKVGEVVGNGYQPLGDVVFGIYTQENMKLLNETIPANTLIKTIKTTADGKGKLTTDLPIGKYYVQEISAPEGYHVKDTKYEFEFNGVTQNDLMVQINVNNGKVITNELIRGQVQVVKLNPDRQPLANAVLEVYTENGALVETITTDNDGKAQTSDLIYGNYYIKELQAPDRYRLTDELIEFKIKKNGEVVETELINQPTRTEIDKYDPAGNKLFGATMQVIQLMKDKSTGEVKEVIIDEWQTTDQTKVIEGLPHGDYILREITAPSGFQKVLDIPFSVTDENKINVLEVTDELTRTEINKYDHEGNKLFGATMQVIQLVKNEETNEVEEVVVEEWETTDETKVIEGLAHGEYLLREITAPDTFRKIIDLPFTITDEHKVTVLEVTDELTRVEIDKYDSKGNKLFGATMQVIQLVEEGDVSELETIIVPEPVSELENTEMPEGTTPENDDDLFEEADKPTDSEKTYKEVIVAEWQTDDETKVFEGLPHGKYLLREVAAPNGFRKVQDLEFEVTDDNAITILGVTDELTRTEIDKYDEEGNKLFGATMQVINEAGEVMEEWQTTDETKVIEGLPHGNYILREITAPDSFQKILDVPFTVTDEDKITVLEVTDELTKTIVHKVDPDGNYVKGAILHILTPAGEIVQEIKTKGEAITIVGLPHGDYILREIKAPRGYLEAEDIQFAITDEHRTLELTMIDEVDTEINLGPVTGLGDLGVVFSTIGGLVLISGGIFYYIKRKNKN